MDREKVIKGKEHLDAIMEVATHLVYPDYGVVQDHCLALLVLLKEQDAEIRQLRLALDIVKGTCNGIKVERSVKCDA